MSHPISFEDLVAGNVKVTERSSFLERLENRTYATRTFPARWGRNKGDPSRFVHKIFYDEAESGLTGYEDEEIFVLPDDPERNRKQVRLHLVKERGLVRQISVQELNPDSSKDNLKNVLVLNRERSARLIELVRSLDYVPIDGQSTSRIDDATLQQIINDESALRRIYEQDPETIQALVEANTTSVEIKELKRRREVVDTMQNWLDDADAFAKAAKEAGGEETAWQVLLEENPWVLGVGLGGKLYTTWDGGKLEQTVRGANLEANGKRADAFLVSNGLLRSVALAEIKHPNTPLLQNCEYRKGVWGVSSSFSGAVAQVQETVRAAVDSLSEWLDERDSEGGTTGRGAYLIEPRSFLIIGSSESLCSSEGHRIDSKFRSFESFRSNLKSPEVLTFDELVERARWNVDLAEGHGQIETE
ncbi:hypothetical protein HMPREF3171_05745 [Corynebacterium sp. HMSC08F01]|uniref:Shedu immune nuclease family protein n=1 Tax=Corynebacterium sp. HMSC08F01 TaxID=1581139 RepID=UPI0008CE1B4B|nr:Shedu immune nuclease family protein [Corynebacterium sp. HMSC08F01]OFT29695.1 hypothetical protein HMPREF3171_05745 [Corynebacterium sp. HMSC08F01]